MVFRMFFALDSNQFSDILFAITSDHLIKNKTVEFVSFGMETGDLQICQLVNSNEEVVFLLVCKRAVLINNQ